MTWQIVDRGYPPARAIADRHYNRQSVGAAMFAPPGRALVLYQPGAVWVTSWPFAEYVKHAWAGAWICSCFRREYGDELASVMIRSAIAATRWRWPATPDLGMVTFVDRSKTRPKRDAGYCYLQAGFERVGETQSGLAALQILPATMPAAVAPIGAQRTLWEEARGA